MKGATTGLLLASLASLALATPLGHGVCTQGKAAHVGIVAIHSGSGIQYASVNATGRGFWIGKPTTTYCPLKGAADCVEGQNDHLQSVKPDHEQFRISETVQEHCPPGNETVIVVASDGYAGLDVEVPGGQRLYVEDVGDRKGYLGFTQAHSASVPEGALSKGFSIKAGTRFGTLYFQDHEFLACPTGKDESGPYRVLVGLKGVKLTHCIGFRAMTVPYTGPEPAAWQYI